jgi:Na+-transporting NADH:ubiquinone oxidoreductase subunit B
MVVVGIIFAVIFGKMVFGGFGKNIFNPAIVGRAFLYISFGVQMTSQWSEPATTKFGALGGVTSWITDAITEQHLWL